MFCEAYSRDNIQQEVNRSRQHSSQKNFGQGVMV